MCATVESAKSEEHRHDLLGSADEVLQDDIPADVDRGTFLLVMSRTGRSANPDAVLPGPIKLHTKAATVYKRAMDESYQSAAAIGYLCKHNATLAAAEGGCQAEIGVASAMAAALTAAAHDANARVVENAAESALEHHLGMTCDPVAGFVQVPCIERCAFGAVKAWTAYAIASNEIERRHR